MKNFYIDYILNKGEGADVSMDALDKSAKDLIDKVNEGEALLEKLEKDVPKSVETGATSSTMDCNWEPTAKKKKRPKLTKLLTSSNSGLDTVDKKLSADLQPPAAPQPEKQSTGPQTDDDPLQTTTQKTTFQKVSLFEFKGKTFNSMVDLIKERDLLALEINTVKDNLDHVSYDRINRFPTDEYAQAFFTTKDRIRGAANFRKAEYLRGSGIRKKACYVAAFNSLYSKFYYIFNVVIHIPIFFNFSDEGKKCRKCGGGGGGEAEDMRLMD